MHICFSIVTLLDNLEQIICGVRGVMGLPFDYDRALTDLLQTLDKIRRRFCGEMQFWQSCVYLDWKVGELSGQLLLPIVRRNKQLQCTDVSNGYRFLSPERPYLGTWGHPNTKIHF